MLGLGVAPHRLRPARDGELDDVLATAREAERLGFDHVIADSHLLRTDQGSTLDPLLLLAAIGGATERIRLATSVLITPLYQPVVPAHRWAGSPRRQGCRCRPPVLPLPELRRATAGQAVMRQFCGSASF
jgi:alkanesulfonate monooxygenase SsuD/methylene tetrahydromethanopterin reductase-like flavin-dependent oxidoreductase (luciferase family)